MKFTLFAMFALLLATSVQAAIMVSNLGNTPDPGSPYAAIYQEDPGAYVMPATPFTTGAAASVLDSVQLSLHHLGGTSPLSVSIWSNSGSVPGTLLATLSGPINPGTGLHDYTGSVSLAASSTYWVVMTTTGPVDTYYGWTTTEDFGESSPAGWTIGNTLAAYTSLDSVWFAELSPNVIPQFSVSATAVPEPSSIVFVAMGLFASWLVSRRFRRSLNVNTEMIA